MTAAQFTLGELERALHGKTGTRVVRFRFEIIRHGRVIGQADAQGSIAYDSQNQIRRTAQFDIRDASGIDWITDMIKPFMLLRVRSSDVPVYHRRLKSWREIDAQHLSWAERDAMGLTWAQLMGQHQTGSEPVDEWAEYPLGLFVLSTPAHSVALDGNIWSVEGYDRTVILAEDSLTSPLYLAAGTKYLDAATAILLSAGIQNALIDRSSGTVLPSDREFPAGTKKIDVINRLLSEINYNSVYCNAEGEFILSRYIEPSLARVGITYEANEMSVIHPNVECINDFYNIPNVFIAECSNPELDRDYRSVFVNDSEASALSTVRRRRSIVSEIYRPEVTTNQADLDAFVRRKAFEACQLYEDVTFTTALMPMHGDAEILSLRHPAMSGAYAETGWTMDLTAGGIMTHRAKRLVNL